MEIEKLKLKLMVEEHSRKLQFELDMSNQERSRLEKEVEVFREDLEKVSIELKELVPRYTDEVDYAYKLGQKRCLKNHNIQNDWDIDDEGDVGDDSVVKEASMRTVEVGVSGFDEDV